MRWLSVPYEPGEIEVVAWKDGKEIARKSVKTAGGPVQLKLTADRNTIHADGMDLSYITIEMVDENGTLCPEVMDMLYFDVDDNIEFLGAGNGNPMGHDTFTEKQHPLFYGKAIVILKSKLNKTGKAKLKVSTLSGIIAEQEIISL
jgi:beta-galactosidase